jgi:adenosylcobinamide hydrolase
MRYYLSGSSLFIRGSFDAVSTGISGGFARVGCLSNHTVTDAFEHDDPYREAEFLIRKEGVLPETAFSLLTGVQMEHLCVFRHDLVTCFITAGLPREDNQGRTINIIVTCSEGLYPEALAGGIITVTEAKTGAILQEGRGIFGTPTDAVIIASEGTPVHRYAGPGSRLGRMIADAVLFGVPVALKRHESGSGQRKESFFIYSRIGGGHWTEWIRESCPYYPCHKKGQSCDFCYCPLYPCGDTGLGSLVDSVSGGPVWNCSSCGMIHDPAVSRYLRANPMASLAELKAVFQKK